MDKSRKLRRYHKKDYSLVVDFPVEIVGRDGVVRRYSFEDSIRLYQRRIASASMRYADADLAGAEVVHCRRRIEQLRRSYVARYGWSGVKGVGDDGAVAAEVAAFLRRCLDGRDTEPETVDLQLLDAEGPARTFVVTVGGGELQSPHLFYVYEFAGDADQRREAFFAFLKMLQGVKGASDAVERLVAFHHTADCGLVLTRHGDDAEGPFAAREEEDDAHALADLGWLDRDEGDDDPLRDGMALLRQGQREAALQRFVEGYTASHWRRSAYIGAAIVADQIGQHDEAETAALMGTRYFPTDPVLLYHLGVARLRRGESEGALEALDAAERHGAVSMGPPLVRGLVHLRAGRTLRAGACLRRAARQAGRDDGELAHSLRRARAQLAACRLLQLSALLLGGSAAFALHSVGLSLLAPAGLVAALLAQPLLIAALRRQVARQLAGGDRLAYRLTDTAALGGALEPSPAAL
jgi:hypothetical protein